MFLDISCNAVDGIGTRSNMQDGDLSMFLDPLPTAYDQSSLMFILAHAFLVLSPWSLSFCLSSLCHCSSLVFCYEVTCNQS
jgi:hypothetical protein